MDNIEKMLLDIQSMLDDMTGKYDINKRMITREFLDEQMTSLSSTISDMGESLTASISPLDNTISSMGDNVTVSISSFDSITEKIQKLQLTTLISTLLAVVIVIYKLMEAK